MAANAGIEWRPTKQVILGPDPGLVLYGEISVWFLKVRMFREREEERMYSGEPTKEDLEIHKALLLRLIADGEHLSRVAGTTEIVSNPEQIKISDLNATTESLRDTFKGWHEPIPPDRRAEVLESVFPNLVTR